MNRIAHIVALLTVVAVSAPFATPDMPWWSGLAIVVGVLAIVGATTIIEDARL